MVSLNDMHPFSLMFSEDISHKGTPPSTHPPPVLRVASGDSHHTPHTRALRCVCTVRAWLFVAFAIGFGAIGASIWMCVDSYQHESGSKMWPGTPQHSLQ